MNKINNKKIIYRIANQTIKSSKKRNMIAIFAISLTTLLFTALFTIGGSLGDKFQESTMRQVGGSNHAGYKYLSQEEYDILKQDKKIKDLSYRIIVGNAINDPLTKTYTEVNYFEDDNAKSSFCYPEFGSMPKKENEIVTSDIVLNALGIPCELGVTVPLTLTIGTTTIEQNFVLSGYYVGDPISYGQMVLVSKPFQQKYAPVITDSSMTDSALSQAEYTGMIMADFNFPTSLFLEQQLAALTKRCNFPDSTATGINWAYMGNNVDFEFIFLIAGLLAIIVASGYLIIYNIFYIHVYSDIRHYGLLKTIGTTGIQLRKIIRIQAYMLSFIGIPIGLIGGVAIGKHLLPMVMRDFSFSSSIDTSISLHPWIFIIAALFSLLTVRISCTKPCKIAAKITPIEAIRATEGNDIQNRHTLLSSSKKTKKNSPRELAFQNVKRNRKKILVVVASLSLALILLNSIYTILNGFDMDKYVANMTVSDFSICDATLDNVAVNLDSRIIDGVTNEFIEGLKQVEGITDMCHIYKTPFDYSPSFTDEDWKKIEERIISHPDFKRNFDLGGYIDITYDDYLYMYRENQSIDGSIYGIGNLAMDKLENVEGSLDLEKFASGNYVIASTWESYHPDIDTTIHYFSPGETVTLHNAEGESRQYEVMAIAELPYACQYQVYGTFDCNFILPADEYLDFMGDTQPMRTLFNVEEAQEDTLQSWIDEYCTNVNPNLKCTSKASIIAEFESFLNMFSTVGGFLAFILALIGILNFINTMLTSILSRKQELAMMEAVGMTHKQQIHMLEWEGLYYLILTGITTIILGALLNVTVVKGLGESFFFYTFHFTLTPILICLPIMLIIVVLVPKFFYQNMCKVNVVERIRRNE